MKKILITIIIFGLIFIIPNISFGSDENSSDGSIESNSNDSGDESASAIVLGIVASAIVIGLSVWGGLTTTKKIRRSGMKKNNKDIATAVFNEATKAYGDKPNISILARYYCCTEIHIIDTISRLSIEKKIDIENALISENIAEKSLKCLENTLYTEASNNNHFKQNIKKINNELTKYLKSVPNLKNIYKLGMNEIAGFYRTVLNN